MSTMFLRTCEKKNSLTINYFEKQKFSDEGIFLKDKKKVINRKYYSGFKYIFC